MKGHGRIARHLRQNAVAYVALFFALTSTGYATATKLLPPNSVGSAQVINGSLGKADLSRKAVAGLRGMRGAPGPRGVQGPQGAQGVPGTARAYGLVSSLGALRHSKNVVSVKNPNPGLFCIGLDPSIDLTTAGLVATPDVSQGVTDYGSNASQTFVEFNSEGTGCGSWGLQVMTGYRQVTTSGSADGDVRKVDNVMANEGFFFVVP